MALAQRHFDHLTKIACTQAEKVRRGSAEEAFYRLAGIGNVQATQRRFEIKHDAGRSNEKVPGDKRLTYAIAVRSLQAKSARTLPPRPVSDALTKASSASGASNRVT